MRSSTTAGVAILQLQEVITSGIFGSSGSWIQTWSNIGAPQPPKHLRWLPA
jgi:hypothetical protein